MIRIAMAAGLAAWTATAAAQPEYDSRIDAAAARIVAGKIGELRGGFAFDQRPILVRPVRTNDGWTIR